jgi:hypothetical protein
MRVFAFTKVIYDGNLTLDYILFSIKSSPKRIFSYLAMMPLLLRYLLKQISLTDLANIFYRVLLTNITYSELQLFKINNRYKVDLEGFGINDNENMQDIILTSEPSFLVELFIDRSKYKVICTEYDIKNYKIIGLVNAGKEKLERLRKSGVNRITYFYVYNFKEKDVFRICDFVLIYRNDTAYAFEDYQMTLKDYLWHNFTNQKWLLYLLLALLVGIFTIIGATFLSLAIPIIEAYIITFALWLCITYYFTVTNIKKENLNMYNVLGYLRGLIPCLLIGALFVLLLGTFLALPSFLVLLIAGLVSAPFLVFELRYYNFE